MDDAIPSAFAISELPDESANEFDMSLDYPFYQELRRRNHPAARWWRWGDNLYYLGLLPCVLLSIPTLYSCGRLPDEPLTSGKIVVFSLFAFFLTIFILGARLKAKAWKMAAKDGINVDNY